MGAGCDVNMPMKRDGATALYAAAMYNHVAVVRELLYGSSVGQPGRKGRRGRRRRPDGYVTDVDRAAPSTGITPLFIAAHLGHAEVVGLLVGAGADRARKALNGQTPLDTARGTRQDAVVALLLSMRLVVPLAAEVREKRARTTGMTTTTTKREEKDRRDRRRWSSKSKKDMVPILISAW